MNPKVLLYDMEITGALGWTYGLYQTNVHHIEVDPLVLSFSYAWYDENNDNPPVFHHQIAIKFSDLFNGKALKEEKRLAKILWKLQCDADEVLGHNSNGFDNKVAMAMFIRHRLGPPSPFKPLDTLVMSKVGKFASHSLENLTRVLGIPGKTDVRHGSIWHDFISGDKQARKLMQEYNDGDVTALVQLYKILRPYAKTHPNMNLYNGNSFSCPRCGGDRLQARGKAYTYSATYQRYWCLNKDCGAWSRERIADKDIVRPELV